MACILIIQLYKVQLRLLRVFGAERQEVTGR
jgi:hypothetical protein